MKLSHLIAVGAAVVALGACNNEGSGGNTSGPVTAEVVPPPQGGDWTKVVSATPEGGFIMGNPNAAAKVVEFGSMTCPHCATFDAEGAPKLIENYVKKGQVSYEYRNYVRDSVDMAASLIARCGGAQRFFPMTRELFEAQSQFLGKMQNAPAEQMQAVTQLPQSQMFVQLGNMAGLQQFAAQRGIPSARANACLANEQEINRLVQMNSDAGTTYNIPGTPAFLVNGELVDGSSWEALEPELRKALS